MSNSGEGNKNALPVFDRPEVRSCADLKLGVVSGARLREEVTRMRITIEIDGATLIELVLQILRLSATR
jgi:hypothetical protein